jgi:hypothetical protein
MSALPSRLRKPTPVKEFSRAARTAASPLSVDVGQRKSAAGPRAADAADTPTFGGSQELKLTGSHLLRDVRLLEQEVTPRRTIAASASRRTTIRDRMMILLLSLLRRVRVRVPSATGA